MAVRACIDDALLSVLPLFGTLLGCRRFLSSGSAAQGQISFGQHPRPLESSRCPRDAFLPFLPFFFVRCCRIHGARRSDGRVLPYLSTPVVRPPDPRRIESAADGGDLDFNADVAASDGAEATVSCAAPVSCMWQLEVRSDRLVTAGMTSAAARRSSPKGAALKCGPSKTSSCFMLLFASLGGLTRATWPDSSPT